jgi:hypothetical protein
MTERKEYPNLPNQNPKSEPTGHFTGRCMKCGSNDLWDDNSAYGCNNCGAWWCGIEPRIIPHSR